MAEGSIPSDRANKVTVQDWEFYDYRKCNKVNPEIPYFATAAIAILSLKALWLTRLCLIVSRFSTSGGGGGRRSRSVYEVISVRTNPIGRVMAEIYLFSYPSPSPNEGQV